MIPLEDVRKVAVVRASRIGDYVCATPALRALRRAVPRAEITLIALPLVEELALRSPDIDRFIPFPGWPGIAEQFFDAAKALAFLGSMQAETFDLVLQMHGSGVFSNPLALMLGGRAAAGFVRDGDDRGRLDVAIAFPDAGHEVDRLLALLAAVGVAPAGRRPRVAVTDADRRSASAHVDALPRPLIALHAGARDIERRWPLDRFAEAASALRKRLGGSIVVVGGADETANGRELRSRVGAAVDLTGRLPLATLAALVGQLSLLITNDSGPAHFAYAAGTPSVTIFSITDPQRWASVDERAIHRVVDAGCHSHDHPSPASCIGAVPVDTVVQAAVAAVASAAEKNSASASERREEREVDQPWNRAPRL